MPIEAEADKLKRDRLLFWTGLALILAGGPGLSLGSFLHDALRIPVIGRAYDAFGYINQTFLTVGLVLLVLGVVFLALGVRGGVIHPEDIETIEVGGASE